MVIVGIGVICHAHKFDGGDLPVCLQSCEVRAEVVLVKSRAINSYDEKCRRAAKRQEFRKRVRSNMAMGKSACTDDGAVMVLW